MFGTTFSVFMFLTFYLQRTLDLSPLSTGLAFLPMTATTILTAGITQTRIVPRTGAKPPIIFGTIAGIAAMLLFTRLTPYGTYTGEVLPGLIVTGFAVGSIFAASIGTATLGVDRREAGVASAMLNTSQQVGGSVGTALLSTLFASAASSYASSHAPSPALATAAAVHGYTTAFSWAAALFGAGLLIALLVLPSRGKPGIDELSVASAETAD